MELSSAITGLVCVALFVVPIILLNRSGSGKRKKRLSNLLAFGQQHGLKFTKTELWNDSVIGLDEDSKKLVFIKNNETDQAPVLIDLQQVTNCEIVNTPREVKSGGKTQRMVDRLELRLTQKGQSQSAVLLEFYDASKSFQLTGELQLIEKWKRLIKENLA